MANFALRRPAMPRPQPVEEPKVIGTPPAKQAPLLRASSGEVPDRIFRFAMTAAVVVVVIELAIISWIRHRYMDSPLFSAAVQVGLGGLLVFGAGVLIGSS